ncbi:hypothetical protein NW755_001866 [Fusarium falciforme]|uniref:Uncharacterized protein n=1 Tax=Fusarium falciforme TaxID=195108 RepID=A0A9W8RFG9_9HYPO|nr:hypothetical protein NW755_001866 [Fusarium falciforme]
MAEETTPVKEAPDESSLETSPLGIDKPVPEAPSDEPPRDDSAEAENTEGETPLHELLLTMAKDDKEPKKKTDLDKLSHLLEAVAQVDAKDDDGGTALHLAAAKGLVEAATKLIDAKANLSELDNERRQPLHQACSEGHLDVVNLLLENGADTQSTEEDGWSPLHLASWTALNAAIYHGHGDAVSALLEQGADVGIQDNDGWTPLMTAIKRKHEGLVKELLDQEGGHELETCDKSGHTPLLAASINGFSAGASLLIKAGANCNVQLTNSKCTPLITASDWGHSGVVKVLLGASRTKPDVHLHNNEGRTALHLASLNGNKNIVKQLLDAKANVDAKDQDGKTALHLASGARPKDLSEQKDELGPDDLSPDEKGMMEFRSGQHAAVVELLLNHGARPEAKTKKKETALHLAAARGDPGRLDLILASMKQEHMSIKNDQGRTALYLACTGDNTAGAWESLLKSDKLKTAEFGRSDVDDDDEIKWAANYPEIHEIAKWLMEERSKRKETAQPAGSDKWSMIEWAAYSQLPEVLSSLIGQSPGSSDTQAALKYALKSKLESTLQSAHELREDAEQSNFRKVLKLLINDVLPTPNLKTALKFVLDVTLDLILGTRANQGAGHKQLLQVLSLLTDSFPGTPEIRETLKSALKLAKKAENQPQDPEQGSIPKKNVQR